MNKILFVTLALLSVAMAGEINAEGRCLDCILNAGDGTSVYCYNVNTCWTSDQTCSGYIVTDWVDCVDTSGYSVSSTCDGSSGIILSYLTRETNSTAEVAANSYCYLTCTNSLYDFDLTDPTSSEEVNATFTLTELSDGLVAYWNDDVSYGTADSSDAFEAIAVGGEWIVGFLDSGALYVVNAGTEAGTYWVDAKSSVTLFTSLFATLGALLYAAL